MRGIVLVAVLLLSCSAGPRHRTLRQGAPVESPPTEYTPSGAGLPEYMPGQQEVPMPRSPHTRTLPQTPDTRRTDGIWAADDTNKSNSRVLVQGIVIDLPADTNFADDLDARSCVAATDFVLGRNDNNLRKLIESLSEQAKQCAIVQTWLYCIRGQVIDDTASGPLNLWNFVWKQYKAKCKPYTSELSGFMNLVADGMRTWHGIREHSRGR